MAASRSVYGRAAKFAFGAHRADGAAGLTPCAAHALAGTDVTCRASLTEPARRTGLASGVPRTVLVESNLAFDTVVRVLLGCIVILTIHAHHTRSALGTSRAAV